MLLDLWLNRCEVIVWDKFLLALIGISLLDIKTKIIPDIIIVTGIIEGIVYHKNIMDSLLGIAIGIGIVYFLNSTKLFRFGGADGKLMGMIGAFIGGQMVLAVSFIAPALLIIYRCFFKYNT